MNGFNVNIFKRGNSILWQFPEYLNKMFLFLMQLVLEINVLKLNNESKGHNLETYFTNLNFN